MNGIPNCSLEYKDLLSPVATVLTALIVMVGWFVSSYLNRKHRIFEMRMERRMSMFGDLVPVNVAISRGGTLGPKDLEIIEKANLTVQFYGYEDEIAIYREFVDALREAIRSQNPINRKSLEKMIMLPQALREELGFLRKSRSKILRDAR